MYINIMELCWLIACSTPDYTEAVVPGIESGISYSWKLRGQAVSLHVLCNVHILGKSSEAEREASP